MGKCKKFLLSFHFFCSSSFYGFWFGVISSTRWSWFQVLQLNLQLSSQVPLRLPLSVDPFSKGGPCQGVKFISLTGHWRWAVKLPMSTNVNNGLQGEREEGCDHGPSSASESNSNSPNFFLAQNGQDMTRQPKSKLGDEMLDFFKLVS